MTGEDRNQTIFLESRGVNTRDTLPTYTPRHELFHRFAMEYWPSETGEGTLLFPFGNIEENLWWHELTAEWGAHQAGIGRLDATEYAKDLDDFLSDPQASLASGIDFFGPGYVVDYSPRLYGSFIFAEYLEGRFGTRDVIRGIYEAIHQTAELSAVGAIAARIDELSADPASVDIRRAMQDFVATTYTLGYDDPDVEEAWRADLENPDQVGDPPPPTEGDALSPLGRPIRQTEILSAYNQSFVADSEDPEDPTDLDLGFGGFKYIDFAPAPGLSGLLVIDIYSQEGAGSVYSASLQSFTEYPDQCQPPIFRSGVGSHTILSVKVGEEYGCTFATLALLNNDLLEDGELPPLSLRATLWPLLRNNAEGGVDDEEAIANPWSIPPVNNTGGASGDVFSYSWGAPEFDDDGYASDGVLAYRFSADPNDPDCCQAGNLYWEFLGWPGGSFAAGTRAHFTAYPDRMAEGRLTFLELVVASNPESAGVIVDARVNEDGTLGLGVAVWDDVLGEYTEETAATVQQVPLDQTIRVELHVAPDRAELRMYEDNAVGSFIDAAIVETSKLDVSELGITWSSVIFGSTPTYEGDAFETYWLDELEMVDLGSAA